MVEGDGRGRIVLFDQALGLIVVSDRAGECSHWGCRGGDRQISRCDGLRLYTSRYSGISLAGTFLFGVVALRDNAAGSIWHRRSLATARRGPEIGAPSVPAIVRKLFDNLLVMNPKGASVNRVLTDWNAP
jgi:hypothetical protein